MLEELYGEKVFLALFLPGGLKEKDSPVNKLVVDKLVSKGFAVVAGEGGIKSSFARLPSGTTMADVFAGMNRYSKKVRDANGLSCIHN